MGWGIESMQGMIGTDNKPLKLSFIVICFICSFIFPFVFVFIFQDIFFFSRDHWFFRAPITSYILFFTGMMLLAILLSLDEWVKSKRLDHGKKTGPWLMLASIVVSMWFIVFSVNNYYYFDDEGLHYNKMFSLEQDDLPWNEISTVEQVTTRHNNMEVFKEHVFITPNGDRFIIPYEPEFRNHRSRIIALSKRHGAKIVERFEEPKS